VEVRSKRGIFSAGPLQLRTVPGEKVKRGVEGLIKLRLRASGEREVTEKSRKRNSTWRTRDKVKKKLGGGKNSVRNGKVHLFKEKLHT